jgi:hypothetical protein
MRQLPPPDDSFVASFLDDEWRTPPAVHRLMRGSGIVADEIAYALERQARAGKIECKHEATMPLHGSPICEDYYRKLQPYHVSYYRKLQVL